MIRRVRIAILCFFTALLVAGGARADLLVAPLRVVLTPDAPEARVRISNQSPGERVVRVRLIDLAATETGGYRPPDLAERDAISAARFVELEGTDFILPPRADAETVLRLNAAALPPGLGERRVHLLVETGAASAGVRRAGGRLADLSLDMASGVSLPVLVRSETAIEPQAAISAAAFRRDPDGRLQLRATLSAEGPHSPTGALVVTWRAAGEAEPRRIGRLANVAVYRETPTRRFDVELEEGDYADGRLTITYLGAEEFAGVSFAERVFDVAPRE